MSGINLDDFSKVAGADDDELLSAISKDTIAKTSGLDNALSFAEALNLTKFGKFNYFVIIVAGLALANVLLETAVMGFILPIAQCDLQLTNQDKGILCAIGFVGIIVSSHLWGFLADTKGRRKVIRPTLLAAFAATLISSFSQTFWVMLVMRFINGFFVSGSSATIYAYLGEYHNDKTRSRAMMGSSFIYAIGAMVLPVIAFLIINQDWILHMPLLGIDYKPWRLFMIVCGIPGFLCGISLFALPESPKFLLLKGEESKTIEILQKMHRWNGGKEPLQISHLLPEEDNTASPVKIQGNNSNFIVNFLQTMWYQTIPLFHKKYLRTTVIICIIQFWLYIVTYGLYMWFPHIMNSVSSFMHEHPGEHKLICPIVHDKNEALYKTDGTMECISKLEDNTYFYSLIMEISYATSFAIVGAIIKRVDKLIILFTCTIIFTTCGLTAFFISDPSIAAYLYVMFCLVGVSINILGAATVELYPTNLRAMAICISLMIGHLGSVVGANVAGAFLGNYCEWIFYITCGALYLCAFSALLIPRRRLDEATKATDVVES